MTTIETKLAQLGNRKDPRTGAVSLPIHLSTAYEHPELGVSTGYDYTRTKNPTRTVLEEGLAELEGGTHAFVTSSGMSAIQLVMQLFPLGSIFLVSRDLYGGSFRYFNDLEQRQMATFHYFTDEEDFEKQLNDTITAVIIETPTNPLMQVVDLNKMVALAKQYDALVIVDNTLLTPLRQRPLLLGADLVIHSGTKFLTGHNDILAGVVVTNRPELGERLLWLSNTTGPTLSAFDCWLFIRSLKTLPLRFNQQEANAKALVEALKSNPKIKEVLYAGEGAMLSIKLQDEQQIGPFLANLKILTYAESLGGVESLITYPTTQTHADIPKELRESYGLTPDLLRISIGIESAEDLIQDVEQALAALN
ncbi:aminotransferase class I/II-fold pyridoxal phosphate-dependent enzyme [Aerococcaceae bacterium zg-ZJ1578]|uniref:aminotransferase class I/II-fold pyridoxal phosphate-dependent enzyme n=1 Tax=Aerococcaceae TaxID=186827 RepID=UPI0013B8C8C7|nr:MULTISPECIES: aminotransferase class I/II-fold pyridoxal phosphate-dependent enzyme [unclassified Facklamia]MBK0347825.1 aminotransferase class I/II-fold pyridoxal phosphate-dependent enzyme [Aerococcaceae bacterium zg-1578]MBS4461046.1 aminotransferase class I/II-fold pyridoxal phosphate-dependent enzyme [Aerococcaceae bacterium zg-B36]QQD64918.1 aminotransferase class I/II-fold pyridoxal phosphate-dependent enzyme [Aerococcaceae bacterium zg-252]NEW64759.1 aminotransferase class I/II-fold 